ncbi:Ran-binding protein 9 [Cyanidiococcus yangmingshanensis]|uniref:Ran-binding protein 9 n=1 Tax=Cyanidiococcus yangmingshanensis TaxID=2690220 RepID=A0A7J7INC8_9RHOD|nr:Ran-binding protein 9 [Cyanidiococcus yangmingshanensis]
MTSTTTTTAHPWLSGHEAWYPVIGMRTVGEILEANFGQKPFLFDIEAYVEEEVERFLNSIVTSQVVHDPDDNGTVTLDEQLLTETAVLDYLLTEGYVETATAFAQIVYPDCFDDRADSTTCSSTKPEREACQPQRRERLAQALKDAKLRASILKCIQRGDLDQASELGREYYPGLFGPSASVFELSSLADDATLDRQLAVVLLQCQRFMEMLHRLKEQPHQDYEALQYAYERLWPLLEENTNESALDFGPNKLLSDECSDPEPSPNQTPSRNRAQGHGFVSRQGVREEEYRRLIRLFILQHLVLLAHADSRTLSAEWLQKRRALAAVALNRAMLLERPCRARPAGASQDAASYLVRMMQHLNTVMVAEVEHGAGYMALVQAKHLL